MPSFSLENMTITAGGRILTGFGESEAVGYKWTKDHLEAVSCCDGAVVVCKILDRSGTVTITLRYDSPSSRELALMRDGASSFSFNCTLPNDRVIESGECWVMTSPEAKFGTKTGDEVWVLFLNPMRVQYEQGA